MKRFLLSGLVGIACLGTIGCRTMQNQPQAGPAQTASDATPSFAQRVASVVTAPFERAGDNLSSGSPSESVRPAPYKPKVAPVSHFSKSPSQSRPVTTGC